MEIKRLRSEVRIVATDPMLLTPQSITYLRTYPALLSAVKNLPRDPEALLYQVSTIAYGWMPRVVRLDRTYVESATTGLSLALAATSPQEHSSIIKDVSACLHSVVGASKVLHFLKPEIFPIWDTKVARAWQNGEPPTGTMTKPENYIDYAMQVHRLRETADFRSFFAEFEAAYAARLERLGIRRYSLTEVRAIEAAAFELAGGDYEDA